MKKISITTFIMVALIITGLSGFFWSSLYAQKNQLALPPLLIAVNSEEGITRLNGSEAITDYKSLLASFEPQIFPSYCGVASSVAVLNALGLAINQNDFFTDKASQVRSRLKVKRAGMSLAELAGLLRAHGLKISVNHMDNISVAEFRSALEKNLSAEGDYLIVNYLREALGQGKVGHISPISAYDRDTDSVLIMDTATHKYPHTWVPIELLYNAMKTTDPASGEMRGYIEVSK